MLNCNYSNIGSASFERAEIALISKDGDRFPCNPVKSAIDRELLKLGCINPRSMKKDMNVPFSTTVLKIILGHTPINTVCKDRTWTSLEFTMEEIQPFCKDYEQIRNVRNKIADEILTSCCDSNCFLLYRKMNEYECHSHAKKVLNYIKYNLIRMIKQKTADVNFYRLTAESLYLFLSENSLNIENEENVIDVIQSWIDIDPKKREKYRHSLMLTVRAAGVPFNNIEKYIEFELSAKPKRIHRDALLLLGGWNSKPTDDIEIFDLETSTWQRSKLKLERPIAYNAAVAIDETLYVFGGTDAKTFLCEMWKISPPEFQWQECDLMNEARNYITNSAVAYNGQIYVFGGKDGRSAAVDQNHRPVRSSTAECYDPKIDKWSRIASMHEERSDCAAAVHGSLIYICGGFNGEQILNTVEVYNPQADFYVPIQNMPSPMSGHAMISHNDKLYIIGGFDAAHRLSKIFVWNDRNEWIEHNEKLKVGRSTFSVASYQGSVIVPGGFSGHVDRSCESILASNSPIKLPIGELIRKKSAAKAVVVQNWTEHLDALGTVPKESIPKSPIQATNREEDLMGEN